MIKCSRATRPASYAISSSSAGMAGALVRTSKMTKKTISLRPYFGNVTVCKTRTGYQREYTKLFGTPDVALKAGANGRMSGKYDEKKMRPEYVVWAKNRSYLAHELSHVVLHVFELADIDPRAANGEPFCYMLSQLMLEAK